MKLLHTQRLWNRAAHNAFTDLVRFGDACYITFREGEKHISDAGILSILRRRHGNSEWTDQARIALDGADLRDAKLCVTPDNQLMLTSAAAYPEGPVAHQTKAWFSNDGMHWSDPVDISEPNHWLWRLNWFEDHAYGFAYGTGNQSGLFWYRIDREGRWTQQRLTEFDGQYVNEHDLCFAAEGTAWCLLRRDNSDLDNTNGLLGSAAPPYDRWQWRDLGFRIGGPCMIWNRSRSGFIAAYRRYLHPAQWVPQWTEVSELGLDAQINTRLQLPSGGDCSYPGLLLDDTRLEVVYYSSHEEDQGTAIYLSESTLDE